MGGAYNQGLLLQPNPELITLNFLQGKLLLNFLWAETDYLKTVKVMDTSRFLLHRPAILDYWQVDRVPVDVKQFIVLNPDKKSWL